KGVDDGALELRAFAHNQGIPIVANPPLARALYQVELGDAIPEPLFETVAVVLRWVDELGRDHGDGDGALPC
ncbi:EscU/YscU/HrcU family type III secretion system export apparatus switch protein, partial [Xanthomonas perforans]|uniref:EscU/YscU/HrcU family type III secretion system export apparatus switch protein n=2 Tax=Xanthomonas TaxID=338 RepID=UPI00116DC4B9